MKIAYLTSIPTNPYLSGGAVHVSQVANKLLAHGHTLYTNLLDEPGKFIKLSEKDFFRRGSEIDIFYIRIHGSAWNDGLTRFRKANLKAPCVWEINAPMEELKTRGVPEEEVQRYSFERKKFAGMVDAAICVSIEMEEYAKDELGIKKTFVIPNGSDPVLFTPEKRDDDVFDKTKFKVLWAGSPEYPWQGLKIVQKLAEKLQEIDEDILFIVTAEGESSGNTLYLGQIPYSEMPKYMASADLGLCIYENIDFYKKFFFSPLKLYDYMASGLPVIGSNQGQIKSVIEEYNNGLLTDTSMKDLIEKIFFLKQKRNLAKLMGSRGRETVVDKYNWENIVFKMEGILEDVSEQQKNKGRFQSFMPLSFWNRMIKNIQHLMNIKSSNN